VVFVGTVPTSNCCLCIEFEECVLLVERDPGSPSSDKQTLQNFSKNAIQMRRGTPTSDKNTITVPCKSAHRFAKT
jgi:hypothetical protein